MKFICIDFENDILSGLFEAYPNKRDSIITVRGNLKRYHSAYEKTKTNKNLYYYATETIEKHLKTYAPIYRGYTISELSTLLDVGIYTNLSDTYSFDWLFGKTKNLKSRQCFTILTDDATYPIYMLSPQLLSTSKFRGIINDEVTEISLDTNYDNDNFSESDASIEECLYSKYLDDTIKKRILDKFESKNNFVRFNLGVDCNIADYITFRNQNYMIVSKRRLDENNYNYIAVLIVDGSYTYGNDQDDDRIALITDLAKATKNNGFVDRSDAEMSFVNATRVLTLSVKSPSTSFEVYSDGKLFRYTSSLTFTIEDTEGNHLIYIDGNGEINEIVNPTADEIGHLLRQYAICSYIYWNATDGQSEFLGEERHGYIMDGATHGYLHFNFGLQVYSGLTLSGFAIGNGSSDSHAQFGVDSGAVEDEDLFLTISAVNSTTGLKVYYFLGADGYLRSDTNAGFSFLVGGSGRMYFNEFTGGAWQLTEATANNKFILMHIFASTAYVDANRMIAFMGQNEYDTLPSAREGATTEISNLYLNGIPLPEFRVVGTVIFQTNATYSAYARVIQTAEGDDYVSWLGETITRGTPSLEHNSLAGRSDAECHPATSITFSQAGNIIADDVQEAIEELDSEKVAKAGDTMTGALVINVSSTGALDIQNGSGVSRVKIDSTNSLMLLSSKMKLATGGETSPDCASGGITLAIGDTTYRAQTFKKTNLTHGLTDIFDPDTFGTIENNNTNGSFIFRGIGKAAYAVGLIGYLNKETLLSSESPILLLGRKRSGTTSTALADTEKIVSVFNDSTEKAYFLGNGSFFTGGALSTNSGTNYWKLAGYTATAPSATGYVTISINGTTYKLLAST